MPRSTKGDDQPGSQEPAFQIQPPAAALDLVGIRLAVETPFAAHLKLEVLNGIGHEDVASPEARILQGSIEEPTGRPNEGPAGTVFVITRLLTHKHDLRLDAALSWNNLRGISIEGAACAASFRLGQFPEA